MIASLASDLFVPQVPLLEKVLRALLVFVFLVVALRLGGKREVGQINFLDLAVLLLVSNALQNALIGPDNSLVGGVVGASTLFAANYVFVRLTFRSRRASRLLEGTPTVLLEHGLLHGAGAAVGGDHRGGGARGRPRARVRAARRRRPDRAGAERAPGDHGARSGRGMAGQTSRRASSASMTTAGGTVAGRESTNRNSWSNACVTRNVAAAATS